MPSDRRRQLAAGAAPCDDIDGLFCLLRDNLGKAHAFLRSAEYQMEQAPSGDEEEDLRRQSNVEHLVAAGKLACGRRSPPRESVTRAGW